jgi:hypothetical protein
VLCHRWPIARDENSSSWAVQAIVPPHAFAVESTNRKADAIAKAQAEGRLSSRLEPRVLLGLIIHLAAFWTMSSPDVLAVMDVTGANKRRRIVRDAVASLLA